MLIKNIQNKLESPIHQQIRERKARFNNALNSLKLSHLNDIKEIEQKINQHRNKICESLSDNSILFFEPADESKFNKTLKRARQSFEQTFKREELEERSNKIYQTYYNNNIKSIQDVFDFIDSINELRPYKISIDYGSIYENKEGDNVKYKISFPPLDQSFNHIPKIIRI